MSAESPTETGGGGFTIWDVWNILRMQRNLVLGFLAAGFVVSVVYTALAPRWYRSSAVVHLSTAAGQEIPTAKVVDMDQYQRWNRNVFVKTQIDILNSSTVLLEVLERYEALQRDDGLVADESGVSALRSMVSIQIRQGTELLDIAVTSHDPRQSAELANLVAEVFRDESLAARTDSAESARNWLETQIVDAEADIERLGAELRDFQRSHDLADAEDKSTTSQAMEALKTAYGVANTERVIQENTVRQHEALAARGAWEQLAKEMDTPVIQQLMQGYATAATEQARLHARYGEKFAERKATDAEMERISKELEAECRRTLGAERARLSLLRDREASLEAEIDSGKESLLERQGSRVGYEKKKLEFETARDNYGRLQVRKSELELQSKTQLNNVRIIQEAVSNPSPVSPDWMLDLVVGLGGGLLLGLAGAVLREWMDDTISSPLEVVTFLRSSFLGLIPKVDGVTDPQLLATYSYHHPQSNVAEALRGIRTLLEMSPDGAPKRLLVTSAVQAEGKTTTSIQLGISFASLDRRVVLVDCDLRRPRLHKVFSDDRTRGVTSVLRGELSIDECLQATGVPNLTFVASGPSGERPSELLSSAALPRFLADLEQRFDVVIVDSPPSVVLSDARVLSKHVDGVVVVVREGAASRSVVRDAVAGLQQVGARLYGVVVNGVDFSLRRNTYKYGYGYGYGYRYARYGYTYAETTDSAAK